MIKFRVGGYKELIEQREVSKETEKTVFYEVDWRGKKREERELKQTSYHRWFDTWDEAHAYIKDAVEKSVVAAERNLERAQKKLTEIACMENPK